MRKTTFLLFIILIFILLRSLLLISYPPFNDESIHLSWSRTMIAYPQAQFVSVIWGGKQPLPFWLYGIAESILTNHPFFAGRLISLFFAFIALIGIYFLTKKISGVKAALFASFGYIINPLPLFFGSQVLMEIMIFTIVVWLLFLLLIYSKTPSLKSSIGIGLLLGIGYWIKSTMIIFIILTYLTVFIFMIHQYLSKRTPLFLHFKRLCIMTVIFVLVLIPLITHPSYAALTKWNSLYGWSMEELIHLPLEYWRNNWIVSTVTSIYYLTPFFLFFTFIPLAKIIPLLIAKKKHSSPENKFTILLIVWFCIPYIASLILIKSFSSRYLLPSTVTLFPLFSIGLLVLLQKVVHKSKIVSLCIIFAAFIPQLIASLVLVLSPPAFFSLARNIPIIKGESELVSGWVSGYGVTDAIDFLRKEKYNEKILILIRADGGNPEDAIVAAFWQDQDTTIAKVPPSLNSDQIAIIINQVKNINKPTYFISRGPQYAGLQNHLKQIVRFNKPWGDEFVGVYKIQ